jgi:hypothetical protein
MAARTGLSTSTLGLIWRQFALKPHLQPQRQHLVDRSFVSA